MHLFDRLIIISVILTKNKQTGNMQYEFKIPGKVISHVVFANCHTQIHILQNGDLIINLF